MPKRHWRREEIEILCNEYPSTPTALLADLLGKSQMSINAKATFLGLKKTPALISQIRHHATDSRRRAR
ncbi:MULTISPECIES: hypothetical protein [unclassified Pantoea]|uniref:hypothetical protein n=1 Tax=unclassified Pantoea TaxID=2630326 RepID=UPI001CD2AAF8|nr:MULTISPECIES: hypothetical protein [unclassified Pantoea]MCA1178891.1 hypothetical protein [Pantoea sp. alder69]MCA1253796.1 hypothetical protein [Pantoea sp. alder70]MCA1267380.1 hypothetical protein [Pantoea sp. alder81]